MFLKEKRSSKRNIKDKDEAGSESDRSVSDFSADAGVESKMKSELTISKCKTEMESESDHRWTMMVQIILNPLMEFDDCSNQDYLLSNLDGVLIIMISHLVVKKNQS